MDTRELAGKFEGKLLEYKYVSEKKSILKKYLNLFLWLRLEKEV